MKIMLRWNLERPSRVRNFTFQRSIIFFTNFPGPLGPWEIRKENLRSDLMPGRYSLKTEKEGDLEAGLGVSGNLNKLYMDG